jgi:hypothetical protein
MNGVLTTLGRLSFGEFIVIWTSTILVVSFYLFLLYYLTRVQKDLNLLKIKIKTVLDLAQDMLEGKDKLVMLGDD